jgi:cyclic beta-1,2-glucan synthetase
LFEHCALALDQSFGIGAHGLPLIGTGDWNDGMNRVGEKGRGESIWLGWLLHAALTTFAPDVPEARAASWRQHCDGTPPGSALNDECRIDAIAQSWSVISGAGDPARAALAMAAQETQLVRPKRDLCCCSHRPSPKRRSIPATSTAIRRAKRPRRLLRPGRSPSGSERWQ